jgi:hypothetical protein
MRSHCAPLYALFKKPVIPMEDTGKTPCAARYVVFGNIAGILRICELALTPYGRVWYNVL